MAPVAVTQAEALASVGIAFTLLREKASDEQVHARG